MERICLIGNNAFGGPVFDGQRIKVRTYKKCLEREGFNITFIELDKPAKRFFRILSEIKKGIKGCDVVVLITSDNGERVLIPYINKINKKYKKRFVFSQIGTSFLYKYIKPMSEERKNAFFYNQDFTGLKPNKKTICELKKIDAILAETDLINNAFAKFFGLDNCYCLTNFRDVIVDKDRKITDSNNKLIYLSRVMQRKGIFDLINAINKKPFANVSLDIYGSLYMEPDEEKLFYSLLDSRIKYCGELNPDKTIQTIQKYDLLCFPTKCEGEGTPGCIVESLIAGTPVLSSDFTQSSELLKDGVDSLLYRFGDTDDLEQKLLFFVSGKCDVKTLKSNAFDSGKRFTYEYNRNNFLRLILGKEVL